MNILLAALAGVLFAFSFPNVAIGWLMFISFVPLFFAIVRARSAWRAFFLGWLSQTIAWMLMAPWVVRVMSHYGGLPYIVGVALFMLMCLYLGLYGAVFAALVHRLAPGTSFRRWLLVPLAWAAVEYIRTYFLTGFPWNLIAASIIDYTSLIQFDRVAGPYAMSMLILLPATTATWYCLARPTGTRRLVIVGGTCIILFVWWATGLVAAKLIARPTGTPDTTAALLQPNISQEMRWNNSNLVDIFKRMMSMTDEALAHGATIVIWPESTVPLSYSSTDFYREAIESTSRAKNADIILGSVAEDPQQSSKLWNAAFLVSGGKTIGHYDKIRLVPFGEYVPLRKFFFFAEKLVHAVGEFEFGAKDTPLVGRFHYGPAICYEIVYPQIARAQVRHGADVLVTITNDAWYDGTSAPRQHLNQARLRAIETDRYLLRAGTTGISALVDPTGRIIDELPMGRQGIIYAGFHPRHTTTPYVRFGDWFAWFACAAVAIAVFKSGSASATRSRRARTSAESSASS
ncbi:MAG: apolipoprotein N-acyltransferase [Acidobacteriota bacterium]|nr:apolipoprotein N-acyltransferase [Acidobacteriota bacterium]